MNVRGLIPQNFAELVDLLSFSRLLSLLDLNIAYCLELSQPQFPDIWR